MQPTTITVGYRCDTWNPPRGATAGDVVRHEQEMGNAIGVDPALLPLLDTLSATRLRWVARTKRVAARYGSPRTVETLVFDPPATVIGNDGPDDGLLVLIPPVA